MKETSRREFMKIMTAGTASVLAPGQIFAEDQKRPPNVVLIMADDIGFSDIGCYGSEIETPNLDRLGRNGMRFTQFYNMAKCNPTRSSLLTGLYFPRENAANAQAFPRLMRDAGYYAATSGKEHFDGWVPDGCRAVNAFDDSFVFDTCISYFPVQGRRFERPFKLNGKVMNVDSIPVQKEPFYKTDVITDYALRFLDRAKNEQKPFLLYLPYHIAHYPLQARKEDIAKYRGRYKKGWDVIRAERFARQKKLGVIPDDCQMSPPANSPSKIRKANAVYRPWDSLREKDKDKKDLEMSVFAAMIDCMDQNIGRVLKKLDEMGEMDNTLIMFLADNGSCPFGTNRKGGAPGGPGSYCYLSLPWANVGDTPFRYYKQYGHEGGCRTQFIAHWPKVIKPGLCHTPSHLVDLFPTMLELSGAGYPESVAQGATPALDGQSLMPLFKGGDSEPRLIMSGFKEDLRMVRIGDWKIARINKGPWELYNMADDPVELNNLAGSMPEKVKELNDIYLKWSESVSVQGKRR